MWSTTVKRIFCDRCSVEMEKQSYQRPYVTASGTPLPNVKTDVYICPYCGKEKENLPNEEDGYSAGAGLFSED